MGNKNIIVELDNFVYSIALKYSKHSITVHSFEQFDSLSELALKQNSDIYYNFNFATVRRSMQVKEAIANSDGLKSYLLTHTEQNSQKQNKSIIAFKSLVQQRNQHEVAINFDIIDKSEFSKSLKVLNEKKYSIESFSNIELSLPLLVKKFINKSYQNSIFTFQLQDIIYLFIVNQDHCEYLYHIQLKDDHVNKRLLDSCGYIFRTYGKLIDRRIVCLNEIDSSIFEEVKDEYKLEISFANITNIIASSNKKELSANQNNIVLLAIATILSEKTDANLFIEQSRKRYRRNIIFAVFSIATVLLLFYQINILYSKWNQLQTITIENTKLTKKLQKKLIESNDSFNTEQLNYIEHLLILDQYKHSKAELINILKDMNIDKKYKFLNIDKEKKQLVFIFEFKNKDLKSLYTLKDKLLKELHKKYTNNEVSIKCTSDLKTLVLDVKIIYNLKRI